MSSSLTPSTKSALPPSVLSAAPDFVQPRFVNIPDEYDPERTFGPHVAALATLAGFPPDPEQRLCLDVSFALNKHGLPLIFKTVVIAPRQNLKTGFLKQRSLGKLFVLQRPMTMWSAHEFDTAQEALNDIEALIEGRDELCRKVRRTSRGHVASRGAVPEIRLLPRYGRARLRFKTRTSGGGRGLTSDDLFVDEAFAAQSAQMGAVLPTMLARPKSQVDFASSACRPESAYLWDLVQQGRSGSNDGRTFYIEWCMPPPEEVCDAGSLCTHARGMPGCGLDKPEVIILAHPAVTRGRITLQKVRDLRGSLPPEEHGREIGGWHDEPDVDLTPIPFELWTGRRSGEPRAGEPWFGIEVETGLKSAAIGAAGETADGRPRVALVEQAPGIEWVVLRCVELGIAHVAMDVDGAAAALVQPLEEAGIWVVPMRTPDAVEACGQLQADVFSGRLVQPGDEPLDRAVEAARKRDLGDAGGWVFGRKQSGQDISALQAAAWALWLFRNREDVTIWRRR